MPTRLGAARPKVKRPAALKAREANASRRAASNGNTLINYCGVYLLDYVVDRNPMRQGRFLPGVRNSAKTVEAIVKGRPNYVRTLPWNIQDEVMQQLAFIREWGIRNPDPRFKGGSMRTKLQGSGGSDLRTRNNLFL
jgi:hypothetical protein